MRCALADRVLFIDSVSAEDFLELLALAAVMLDPLHFNGMNASLEAIASPTGSFRKQPPALSSPGGSALTPPATPRHAPASSKSRSLRRRPPRQDRRYGAARNRRFPVTP